MPERNVVLAQGPVCRVECCRDCDTIRLHIGNASVRLPDTAFAGLCRTLLCAMSELLSLPAELWPLARHAKVVDATGDRAAP